MNDLPPVAILGLGEAGSAFAEDLVALGASVRGFDPKFVPLPTPRPGQPHDRAPLSSPPSGVELRSGDADAVRDAALVFSLTTGTEAEATLRASLPTLRRETVWAEANTASPVLKRRLAALAPGLSFVDAAIMAPVPGKGLRTPMYASGAAAVEFSSMMERFGIDIELVPGGVGAASSRKLLRSVVYKGLAAAVTEAANGAAAAGCEDWFTRHLSAELQSFDADTVTRLISGTRRHAARRAEEMAAAAQQLDDLGVASTIAAATRDTLRAIVSEGSSQ